jgi:hypothetical protein
MRIVNTSLLVLSLAVAAITNCSVSSSEVTPSPTPAAETRIPVGTAPGMIVASDLNADGFVDVAIANEQSNDVTILLGDGKGKLTAAKGSPFAAGNSPNDITVADFNRDGKPDLAFANHEKKYLTVLLGDGSGGFKPAPNSPFTVEVRPHPHGVASGDLNGDTNPDLVTESWGTDQVEVLFGDGKGGFKLPGSFFTVGKHPYQRLRIADVNRDRKADILTTNLEGDNVTILLGDGKGGFKPAGAPAACGDSPFNFTIGDVNADGNLDLAVVNSPSSTSDRHGRDGLTVLLGDSKGGFKIMAGSPFVTGKIPNQAAIGDVNGDGINDIAVSSPDGDNVTLYLMSRAGAVASTSTIEVAGHPKGMALTDLNSDGKADMVITCNSANAVAVILSK